jgi:hypothetical protein
MAVKKYEKIDIARQQLDTAIELFFQGGNHFAIITLAGAADEIFGKFLGLVGRESSLANIVRSTALFHKMVYGEELPHKEFILRANLAKNSIKHLDSEDDLTIALDAYEEMIEMLVRATDNYYGLDLPESEQVLKFTEWYFENVVGY